MEAYAGGFRLVLKEDESGPATQFQGAELAAAQYVELTELLRPALDAGLVELNLVPLD